jgi:hypothetical protein
VEYIDIVDVPCIRKRAPAAYARLALHVRIWSACQDLDRLSAESQLNVKGN